MISNLFFKPNYKTFFLIILLFMFFLPKSSEAWWNDQWKYRKKITFNTTQSGAKTEKELMNMPVLIRLHTGNFDFTNAKDEGDDIRFVSSDDKRLLKHHIEFFDLIDELAVVWVKIPRLPADTDKFGIWMYYGNDESSGGQDTESIFDQDQTLAFHFEEAEGMPADSSSCAQQVKEFAGGLGLPSVIGSGVSFNGAGDKLVITSSPMNSSNGFTFSAWVRIDQAQTDAYLFSVKDKNSGIVVGIDDTGIYARIKNEAGNIYSTEGTDLDLNKWHYLTVTGAPGRSMRLYLEGSETSSINISGWVPEFTTDYMFAASSEGSHEFIGDMDELRLSKTARSDSWIQAAFASQGPGGTIYSLGMEEIGEGGAPVFYLATVLKNITMDGWLVIGLLLIMAVASWIVFLSKTFLLFICNRENRAFSEFFSKIKEPVEISEKKDFENSCLYRLYMTGAGTLKDRRENRNKSGEDRGMMNSLRANLEKGFMEETKSLNSWMVILTMAITGGPFLGLLGTVWGVMNTFAAMAEAGEANIMAIAPGVASALSTTVFGLIVAIPALFGYNYLVGQIKNTTAELAAFIDQFLVKVDDAGEGEIL